MACIGTARHVRWLGDVLGENTGNVHALLVSLSNGRSLRFDGIAESEHCMHLLQKCGSAKRHAIRIESDPTDSSIRDAC